MLFWEHMVKLSKGCNTSRKKLKELASGAGLRWKDLKLTGKTQCETNFNVSRKVYFKEKKNMFVHIKFINLPHWHTFCIQKSYRLHKSVSQARPQNRLMSSHPIRKQYWSSSNPIEKQYYKGTKS